MSKKISGYAVQITGFMPCDVNRPNSIPFAESAIGAVRDCAETEGFMALKVTRKYRQKADVPDENAPEKSTKDMTAAELEEHDRKGMDAGERRGLIDPDAEAAALATVGDMPERLRRRKAAE